MKQRPKIPLHAKDADVPRELRPALEGRWGELPEKLPLRHLERLGLMVNGYDIRRDHLAARSDEVLDDYDWSTDWEGTAVELLYALFMQARQARAQKEGSEFHRSFQRLYEVTRQRLAEHPEEVQLMPNAHELARGTEPPTRRCYWVVPGKLLAGAYPESPVPSERGERVEALVRAGIRTFVSLMEERETDTMGDALVPYDVGTHEGVRFLRIPIRDGAVPTPWAMQTILNVIDLSLEANRPVYVHCMGGLGRTGTVIGCWLRRHGFASGTSVLEVLSTLRLLDKESASRQSPETSAQREMVLGWRD